MKTISLIFAGIALYLLPLCSTLQVKGSITANTTKTKNIESNNAYAKVINVKPHIDNEWMVAKIDPTSPSGWAVEVRDYINDYFFNNYFLMFMYARNKPTTALEEIFRGRICVLLNPKDTFYPQGNFLPRQIIKTIFPGRYGSCNIENSTKPIDIGAPVNINAEKNKGVKIPKSQPFQLVVNILPMRYINSPDTNYYFQVNYTVGSLPKMSGTRKI